MLPGPQGLIADGAAPGAITLPMLASQSDQTMLGNVSGAAASPSALTADQVRTMENASTVAVKANDVQITKTAPAIAAGVLTLNCALSNFFAVSLDANVTTLTISNPAASGKLTSIQVMFTADGTVRTVAAPSGGVYPGGAAPVMTGTLNKRDFILYESVDGGTTWFIFTLGQNL